MEKILDGVTDEIKKLKKKITGRKMLETETDPLRRAAITALMDEQEDNMAEVHAKLYEEVIFSRAMALRSLFDVPKHSEWHDDFLSNPANFHKQTALLGGHGSDVHIAALGGQSFGDRLKTLGQRLEESRWKASRTSEWGGRLNKRFPSPWGSPRRATRATSL